MTTQQRIIWLTSFPKSGNTWLRILLAHYFMPKEQAVDINSIYRFTTSDMRQDFFDKAAGGSFVARDLQHWLSVRQKALGLIAVSKPNHHFVKTHSCLGQYGDHAFIPPGVTAGAIYILRNPFDVALSYARHLSIDVDTAIDRMLDRQNINASMTGIREVIGRWDEHVASWQAVDGLNLAFLRYEDLLDDTFRSMQPVFDYLGQAPDAGKLRWAIRKTSFKELQKQEAAHGFRERPKTMTQFFVSGTSGAWRESMTAEQIARLAGAFRPALDRYYPEISAELKPAADPT